MGGGGNGLGLVGKALHRLDSLLQPRTVALNAIVGDMTALRLEPFGEILIAAERPFHDAPLHFSPHLSRQHRHLSALRNQRSLLPPTRSLVGDREIADLLAWDTPAVTRP